MQPDPEPPPGGVPAHDPVPQSGGPPPVPYRPQLTRTMTAVGAPTSLLIVAGIATATALSFDVLVNPALAIIGLVLSGLACAFVVFSYLWLDRWEPEPPWLLLFAWLWGGIAVVFSLVTSLFDSDPFTAAVIRAPIVEELAKGAFLVIMTTGVRRRELNTLIDCLVYAGLVGAAFGFIENVLYLARGETLVGTFAVGVLRLATPFLHSFFTSVTAIGLYVGLTRRSRGALYGWLVLGYVGAVLLHMAWNATSLAVHAVLFVPLFGGAVALALIARRREQRVLVGQVPGIVAGGLVTPAEGAWASTMAGRRMWRSHAARFGGSAAKKAVTAFTGAVTELAFVRDRFDRGFGSPEAAQRYAELAGAITSTPRPPVPPTMPPPPPPISPRGPGELHWAPVPGSS